MNEAEDIERVQAILSRILAYQHDHSGAAIQLDALVSAGVLSPEDQAFLASHSIDYKPHQLGDYHGSDTFHIPTDDGCMFIGPVGPPLPKHSTTLPQLGAIIERALQLPRPADELLLHIELSEGNGVGVSPGILSFMLHSPEWRSRAEAIKSAAADHGLAPFQDSPELQGKYILSFTPTADAHTLAAIALDLLRLGLGLADTDQITFACGAIEEALQQQWVQSAPAGTSPIPDFIYEQLVSADRRFTIDAFRFVTRAVFAALSTSGGSTCHHVSGCDVAEAFRLLALSEFGTGALPTLHGWGIRSTDDIGTLVFRMIEFGVLGARPEDTPEDFHSLYHFASAFPTVA